MNTLTEKRMLTIQTDDSVRLEGNLNIPDDPKALVIFSHGSGSSRFSPRNNFVAEKLNEQKMATLLIDLLSEQEDINYRNRFDIDLLTERLIKVTSRVHQLTEISNLPIGYFGASTGAASALNAAAVHTELIAAVVSRGGRPDLALDSLPRVKAPVLLIVGSLDYEVISLNQKAYAMLTKKKRLEIVSGASHLFEEPGKLEVVAELSAGWFREYLIRQPLN
jgi:pimeloyl-ACP methyl ester carboxylesterase